jgi:photosystem II oxygen-evolving enhancer protein 2
MVVIGVAITLQGCVGGGAGLQSYVDSLDGYQFLYPTGWAPVQVSDGPDVVFRDLIQETENVSVVISPVSGDRTLTDLGSPSEVGYQLSKSAIAPPDSGRSAELIDAAQREDATGKTYYLLEYAVQLPNQQARHDLVSVTVSRGRLFTIDFSTVERRWSRVADLFKTAIGTFSVN